MWSVTMLVGLLVVAVSAAVAFPMMFGRHDEPATVPVASRRVARASSQRRAPNPVDSGDVRLPWWRRVRAGVGLLAVTVAAGAALAVVLGVAVIALGLGLS